MRNPILKIALAGLCLVAGVAAVVSCSDRFNWKQLPKPSKKIVRQTFTVNEFTDIEATDIEVVFRQADSTSVVIEAPENYIQYAEAFSDGTTLVVQPDFNTSKFHFWGSRLGNRMKAYITSPNLTDLDVTGSGTFRIRGLLDTDELSIEHVGSGRLIVDSLICNSLDHESTGWGSAFIGSIRAGKVESELTGSGSVKMNILGVPNVELSLTGSGDYNVALFNCGMVSTELMGSGNIFLSGSAKSVEQDRAGSGTIVDKTTRVK